MSIIPQTQISRLGPGLVGYSTVGVPTQLNGILSLLLQAV